MASTNPIFNCGFNSFCVNPDIRFENQRDGEEVILLLRASLITYFSIIINSLILFILIFLFNYLSLNFLTSQQTLFINAAALIFVFSYLWLNFIKWFFNVGIITNERVVDIDFSNVTYKEVTEAPLSKIEDTTSKSGGYLQSFFNYGDVIIQTAGEQQNIDFINVPKPSEVVKIINDLLDKINGHR